jgi:transcription antitermination factor NusB
MTTKIFPRTVSRLAAIQATFQHLLRPSLSIDEIVQDFLMYRFAPEGYDLFQDEPFSLDQDFFIFIAKGAQDTSLSVERMIAHSLPRGWSIDQMENTTRAIFRCAGFEIQACKSTPKGVILNEYIMAAHCFLLDKGHALVNAVLDKAFYDLRPEDVRVLKKETMPGHSIHMDLESHILESLHQVVDATPVPLPETTLMDGADPVVSMGNKGDVSSTPAPDGAVDFIAPTSLPSSFTSEFMGVLDDSDPAIGESKLLV